MITYAHIPVYTQPYKHTHTKSLILGVSEEVEADKNKWQLSNYLVTTHSCRMKNIVPFPPLRKSLFIAPLFKCSLIPTLILLPIVWYSDAMQCYEYPSNSTDSLCIEHLSVFKPYFTPLFLFSSLILYMLLSFLLLMTLKLWLRTIFQVFCMPPCFCAYK